MRRFYRLLLYLQYQEAVDILNTEAKQTPHVQLITGIQRENRHLLEIHAENKELRNALEDHQNALELIMSKYRQQIASLMRLSKTDSSSLHNTKYANVSRRKCNCFHIFHIFCNKNTYLFSM